MADGDLNPTGLACIVPYGLVDQYRCSNYPRHFCKLPLLLVCGAARHNLHRPPAARPAADALRPVGAITEHTLYDWWREALAVRAAGQSSAGAVDRALGQDGTAPARQHSGLRGGQGAKEAGGDRREEEQAHHLFDQIEFHEQELLPFYDAHLKGIDNGFMDGAPVRLFIRGTDVWREEPEWPLKRAKHVSYYLRKGPSGSVTSLNDGGLSTDLPAADEPATSYSYPDWEWMNGVVVTGPDGRPDAVRRVLTFSSAPLAADIEVTGPIVLELHASSDQIDTRFIVKLADQHPQDEAARAKGAQPAFTNVAKGWLQASHREKDESRTTEMRPFYTHTNPQPLTPGEIYRFDIEVLPVAYVFRKGHRIRLEIVNGDSAVPTRCSRIPTRRPRSAASTIHHDRVHASCLRLPVISRSPHADASRSDGALRYPPHPEMDAGRPAPILLGTRAEHNDPTAARGRRPSPPVARRRDQHRISSANCSGVLTAGTRRGR
jgi:hypothetical protein